MKCRDFQELILRAIDDALAEGEQARLTEHLASCAECRAMHEGLGALIPAIARIPEVDVPADFEARVMRRVRTMAPPAAKEAVTPLAGLYISMGVLALLLVCAVSLDEAGLADLLLKWAQQGLGVLAQAWNIQIVYQILASFLSHEIRSLVDAVEGACVMAGLVVLVAGFRRLFPGRPAFQKAAL